MTDDTPPMSTGILNSITVPKVVMFLENQFWYYDQATRCRDRKPQYIIGHRLYERRHCTSFYTYPRHGFHVSSLSILWLLRLLYLKTVFARMLILATTNSGKKALPITLTCVRGRAYVRSRGTTAWSEDGVLLSR